MKKIIATVCLAVLVGGGVLTTTSGDVQLTDLTSSNIEATSVSARGMVCDPDFVMINCVAYTYGYWIEVW